MPSFGDPAARLLIIGLAPGAHGANHFPGECSRETASGEFLYQIAARKGFASQPESRASGDGLPPA